MPTREIEEGSLRYNDDGDESDGDRVEGQLDIAMESSSTIGSNALDKAVLMAKLQELEANGMKIDTTRTKIYGDIAALKRVLAMM